MDQSPQTIQSKLRIPILPEDYIERPQLLNALEQNRAKKLTWIAALVGSGKSTLAGAWLHKLKRSGVSRGAWVAIDEADNNLITFWSYVAAAIESAFPNACAGTRDLLFSGQVPSAQRIARTLTGECKALPKPLVLVLDDYHLIDNSQVHDSLVAFVGNQPPNVHLVVVSRGDPPAALDPLVRGQLGHTFTNSDLLFTNDEAETFLKNTLHQAVPEDVSRTLNRQLEGWVAGLRLVAISLHGRNEPAIRRYVQDFQANSSRYVIDFLIDQVLAAQPADVQSFLLRSSVLPRFSAPLCRSALGEDAATNAQQIIQELDRTNLFIIKLDERRVWYRYHHQFQGALQQRLRSIAGAEAVAEIQRRGAKWFAANGRHEDAIRLFIQARDFDGATQVVAQVIKGMNMLMVRPYLERWLSLFPAEYAENSVVLTVARSWASATGLPSNDVLDSLDKAERTLDHGHLPDSAERDAWRGHVHLLRMRALSRSMGERQTAEIDAALALLPLEHTWPRLYAISNKALSMTYTGHWEQSRSILLNALAQTPPERNDLLGELRFTLTYILYYCGTAQDAYESAEQLLVLGRELQHEQKIGLALLVMGRIRYVENDLETAERLINEGLSSIEPWDTQLMLAGTYRLLEVLTKRGKSSECVQAMAEFRNWHTNWGNSTSSSTLAAFEAFCAAHRGDMATAMRWASTQPASPTLSLRGEDYETHVLAQVLLINQEPGQLTLANRLLLGLAAQYRAMHISRNLVMVLTWQAQVCAARSDTLGALDALEEAIAIGYPLGYVRWFAAAGPDVEQLLRQLAETGRHKPEATTLLQIRSSITSPEMAAPSAKRPTTNVNVPALSQRELEVLQLLVDGMTNKQIAHQLKLSPITVRNHTSKIYAKLQVRNRKQAARQATLLGLIATQK